MIWGYLQFRTPPYIIIYILYIYIIIIVQPDLIPFQQRAASSAFDLVLFFLAQQEAPAWRMHGLRPWTSHPSKKDPKERPLKTAKAISKTLQLSSFQVGIPWRCWFISGSAEISHTRRASAVSASRALLKGRNCQSKDVQRQAGDHIATDHVWDLSTDSWKIGTRISGWTLERNLSILMFTHLKFDMIMIGFEPSREGIRSHMKGYETFWNCLLDGAFFVRNGHVLHKAPSNCSIADAHHRGSGSDQDIFRISQDPAMGKIGKASGCMPSKYK